MKHEDLQPEDQRLRSHLRESIAQQPIPPGFRQAVWRKIERAEIVERPSAAWNWLDAAAAWLLRPRLALAVAALMMVAGSSLGVAHGVAHSKQAAQDRYIARVSPLTAHE